MKVFQLDLRSLALLRVSLGFLVLLDTLLRARDLEAFYTDDGLLPRADLVERPWGDPWLCLHLGAGGVVGQAVLFLLTAFCAIQLMRGWRTRLMIFACWLSLNSLYQRNPLVNDRGDLELILVLFWSFFLPLGARWSADARRHGSPAEPACTSLASAALVLQFAQIYLFAALLKNGLPWLRGDALLLSCRSALFCTPLSQKLAEYPELLQALTHPVIALELLIPCLLLFPWANGPIRSLGVLLLVVFHGLVAALFQLGLFPLIGGLLPIGLLPTWFWEGPGRGLDRRLSAWLVAPTSTARTPPRWQSLLVGISLLYTIACNLFQVSEPSPRHIPPGLRDFGRVLRLEQHWDLFSPLPPYDGWFILKGETPDGPLDLLRDRPLEVSRPADPSAIFPNHRWRMLMISLLFPPGEPFRGNFASYQAGLWKARHPGSNLGRIQFLFAVQLVDDQGNQRDPSTWILWDSGSQNLSVPNTTKS